ncbi:MAG: hypothetical protein WD407_08645 [Rhodospirillales bacterium]
MADMRAELTVDLGGNVDQRARQMDRAMSRFSRSGRRSLSALGRGAQMAGRGIDRLGNRYTALITGAAGIGTARSLINLEERFVRLGIQSNKSAEQMESLKKEIFEVAQQKDIRVDPSEITSAIEKIVEKTGDLDNARLNIRNIGLALSATGAAGQDVGAMIADLQEKFGLKDKDEFLKNIDLLTRQGKSGAFTLQHIATQGERVTAAYAATGRTGPIAVREMGALLQMIKRGVGPAEQAATAYEAYLRTLQQTEKLKKLKNFGIQIMDPDNPKVMRSAVDIMKEIIKATGGSVEKLGLVFESEAIKAFSGAIIEFKQTGGFESFDKFYNVQADGKQIMEDSAAAADTAAGSLRSLSAAFQKHADAKLSEPIKALAKVINDLSPEKIDDIMDSLAKGAMVAGGLIVATKALRGIAAVRGAFGRRGGAGGLASGTFTRPQPVVVVNWPPALGGSGAAARAGGSVPVAGAGRGRVAARGGRLGRLAKYGGRAGRFLGRAALPITAAPGALTIASSAMAGDTKGAVREGGALAGGLAGAAAGSLLGPIGTIVGGIAGAFGGERIGDLLASLLDETKKSTAEQQRQRTEVGGKIELAIRKDGSIDVERLQKTHPGFDISVDTNAGGAMVGTL